MLFSYLDYTETQVFFFDLILEIKHISLMSSHSERDVHIASSECAADIGEVWQGGSCYALSREEDEI